MAEDGFRNTAYGMGFEAGLDALRDVIGAAQALVADLEGAENAWQGVGVLAVEIRKLVELRVALREAGYLPGPVRSRTLDEIKADLQSEPETSQLAAADGNPCTGIHHGHAGRWMCGLGFGPLCGEDAETGVQGAADTPVAGSIPAPGSKYAPWMVDGRKPTIADYMEYAR